jgi:hypothetical protein
VPLPGIGYGDTVDLVVGQLLQPVPVESQPHVFEQFVGGRVVNVKDLSRLHVFNAESNKRIVIGGVPEIVESGAQTLRVVELAFSARHRS